VLKRDGHNFDMRCERRLVFAALGLLLLGSALPHGFLPQASGQESTRSEPQVVTGPEAKEPGNTPEPVVPERRLFKRLGPQPLTPEEQEEQRKVPGSSRKGRSGMSRKPEKSEQKTSRPRVDQEAVAKLAYEMWLTRKAEHGHDVEDWLAAERLLLEEESKREASQK